MRVLHRPLFLSCCGTARRSTTPDVTGLQALFFFSAQFEQGNFPPSRVKIDWAYYRERRNRNGEWGRKTGVNVSQFFRHVRNTFLFPHLSVGSRSISQLPRTANYHFCVLCFHSIEHFPSERASEQDGKAGPWASSTPARCICPIDQKTTVAHL
jgi:hypothetical protein